MHARARRRVTATLGVCVVMVVGPSACADRSEPVEAGAAAEAGPTAPGAEPAPTEPATTTIVPEPDGPDVASPVDGLTAAELRAVVEAPPSPAVAGRRRNGPVADRVPVGGRTVWRITIPGTYDLLSSRVVVAVGGRDVGDGLVDPDLTELVAVVTDPALVVAGAAVTYRWGANAPIEAGPLEVVR